MVRNVYGKSYTRINQEMGTAFLKFTTKIFENFKNYSKIPFEGESVGYTVKSMEKDFPISNYPLLQTEFLYDSKQGKVIKEIKHVNHMMIPDSRDDTTWTSLILTKTKG